MEWNFDLVPADEIEVCFYYEYAREYFSRSPTLQRLRQQWLDLEKWWNRRGRKKPRPPVPEKHRVGLSAPDYAWKIINLCSGFNVSFDFRSFPELGWQELRKYQDRRAWPAKHGKWEAERKQKQRDQRSDRFHIETLTQLGPANIRSLPVWIHYHEFFRPGQDLSDTEYGFFAVNWDYPLPAIKRAFNGWLEERAKLGKRRPRFVRRSRGQFNDRLRWLGALRVRRHYRRRDLIDYGNSNLKVDAPYSHFPDLVKAAKKAERLVVKMYPPEAEAARIAAAPIKDEHSYQLPIPRPDFLMPARSGQPKTPMPETAC
jgi:hypothetical protein